MFEYEVSDSGTVRHIKSEHICKKLIVKDHAVVKLCKHCTVTRFDVTLLVANAFVDNPERKPVAGHRSWDTFDDRSSNIIWKDE